MQFASALEVHLQEKDQWAWRVASRTARWDLHRTERCVQAGTAEQMWKRSAPAPRGHRQLGWHWRDLREPTGAASRGAIG